MRKRKKILPLIIGILFVAGCADQRPKPINTNQDICAYCKMGISDVRFASELITSKGKVYKFDSIECLVAYYRQLNATEKNNAKLWVNDFLQPGQWISAETALFLRSDQIHSPMSLNLIAVSNESESAQIKQKFEAESINWADLLIYVAKNME